MSLFDDLKAAISTGDTTKLQSQLEDLVGDIDLSALRQKFEASGLGDKVDSWISTGPNTPATAEDIKKTMDPQSCRRWRTGKASTSTRLRSERPTCSRMSSTS